MQAKEYFVMIAFPKISREFGHDQTAGVLTFGWERFFALASDIIREKSDRGEDVYPRDLHAVRLTSQDIVVWAQEVELDLCAILEENKKNPIKSGTGARRLSPEDRAKAQIRLNLARTLLPAAPERGACTAP